MANANSPELYRIEEWTIENFSCWNREIHGNVISTTKYLCTVEFLVRLYPKGLNGREEDMVVSLRCSHTILFSGELSYTCPNGSIFYTQQVASNGLTREVTLASGPKFEEVISDIKKNEDVNGDRLIIRYRLKRQIDSKVLRTTTINVFNAAFRIYPEILNYTDSSSKTIFSVAHQFGEGEIGGVLTFRISEGKTDRSRIWLTLQADPLENVFLVRTRMSVLNKEDVVRTEENEHLFRDCENWTFAMTVTKAEMAKKWKSLILHFKIIPTHKPRRCTRVFHYYKDAVEFLPTEKSSPPATKVVKKSSSHNESNLSLKILSEELMYLQKDEIFSDCELKCGTLTFSVHKNILSARSPVFKTMLSCDMQEAATGCMEIVDMEPATLSDFLAFLYTGRLDALYADNALKLFYAADKYDVSSLQETCIDFLCENVTISNVCEILSLANKHQVGRLTAVAQDFIFNNFNEVLRSSQWKIFIRSESLLAVETVTYLAETKNFGRRDVS